MDSRKKLVLSFVALPVVVLSLFGYAINQARQASSANRRLVDRTNIVLCTFRGDLQARVKNETITLDHPTEFGVSRATLAALRVTIASQTRTIHSLKGLTCLS